MFRRMYREEDGAITVLALFLFVATCALLGIALDVANAYRTRTKLQVAADTGGHAALYMRAGRYFSEDDAKQVGVTIAAENLDLDPLNTTIGVDDIEFGDWNRQTRTFTPRPGSYNAVRVIATKSRDRRNQLDTFLLGFAGLRYWNISTHAVVETFRPGCLREGMVAEGVLDIQSNNGFAANFCLHSNTYISINQNNFFEPGSIVSMPNLDLLDIAASGFERNEGLEEALMTDFYDIHVPGRIDFFEQQILAGNTEFLPDYIDGLTVTELDGDTFTASDFVPGSMYRFTCEKTVTKGKTTETVAVDRLTLRTGENEDGTVANISEVVLFADCPVQFEQGLTLMDTVFFNDSTDPYSFTAPHGLNVGDDDGCSPGGGAQLLTLGGMRFAAELGLFGGQLIAQGDIQFAARAGAVEGASIVSGGEIDGTSNATMGYCSTGMEDNFEVDYFRIVE
ncbi:TadE/TadG family type IV pilus assembly protein [Ostreiculturibacter nitratireducens]|uniref:TadE/TadG family type IV pilus assembly protein n=1 Tax=Ostreiculturibacter nitratireducens TaxID=3075226 RepID=UPI0031B5BC20